MSDDRVWTDERQQVLTSLWADGLSCSQIALAMNEQFGSAGAVFTRNSIIGKVHRMKLSRRAYTHSQIAALGARALKPRRVRTAALERGVVQRVRNRTAPARKPVAFEPRVVPQTPPDPALQVTLMDRTAHQCGFVIGEPHGGSTLMCGTPKPLEANWCAYHKAIVYNPERPKRKRGGFQMLSQFTGVTVAA